MCLFKAIMFLERGSSLNLLQPFIFGCSLHICSERRHCTKMIAAFGKMLSTWPLLIYRVCSTLALPWMEGRSCILYVLATRETGHTWSLNRFWRQFVGRFLWVV